MSLPIKYSYSGADCRARAKFGSDGESVVLDSLATISYSIYEAKSPVRALGHRTVKGYTESIRTVAGSMVFLVIEDHPLAKLVSSEENRTTVWSKDLEEKGHSFRKKEGESKRFISTLLRPFNIDLFYKTEVAFTSEGLDERRAGYKRNFHDGAHLQIKNINIVSEGMVTSVNDMVTEITMQFVAEDVFNIETTNNFDLESEGVLAKTSAKKETKRTSVSSIISTTTEITQWEWSTEATIPKKGLETFNTAGIKLAFNGERILTRKESGIYSHIHRYDGDDRVLYAYYPRGGGRPNFTWNEVYLSEKIERGKKVVPDHWSVTGGTK